MAAGLQVTNDSGVFQIDDTYRNLQFISKTAVTAMTHVVSGSLSTGYIDYWYYDITVSSATNPVVALASDDSNWIVVGAVNISGGTWTFRVYSYADADFTYYVFDVPTASGTVGLEVFNSSGVLQYTSGRGPFRPVQLVRTTSGEGPKTTSLPGGRTYACATVQPGRVANAMSNIGDPKEGIPSECSQYHYTGGFRLSGTTLYTAESMMNWYALYKVNDFSCGLMSGYDDNLTLAIDVTNL